jgi:hypothetical protein
MPVTTYLINFETLVNIFFIVKVKILMLMKWLEKSLTNKKKGENTNKLVMVSIFWSCMYSSLF